MIKNCFLFPGQGAQYPGMGKDFFDSYKEVRDLFALGSEATGTDIPSLLFESDEASLKKTDNTQIAITAVNLAAAKVLVKKGIEPHCCAGFSLGEYSGLCLSGILTCEDTFRAVKQRGILMQENCDRLSNGGDPPGMAAVMGLDYRTIVQLLNENDIELYAANINSPVQTVVSGTAAGIKNGEELFKKAGAKRYIPLKVAGPFHSPLMEFARDAFSEFLATVTFADPDIPCYSNVTGEIIKSGDEARQLCIEQMVSPVQWVKEQETILQQGYNAFYETGPGKVLQGLWKYISKDIPCTSAGTIEEINTL
ncbi:MAG: ACP S-malonyltransferase [Spirochaetales bacterium]|nr:ACP S-malonyltransferase [Spirochaetales bacterium]